MPKGWRAVAEWMTATLLALSSATLSAHGQLLSPLPEDVLHRTLEAVLLEQSQQSLRASEVLGRQLAPPLGQLLDASPELQAIRLELLCGNRQLAIARLSSYLEQRPILPFRAEAYYLRGVAQFDERRYALAALDFDSAATQVREHKQQDSSDRQFLRRAQYWKAVALMHHSSFEQATQSFSQLLEDPSDYCDDAYVGLGTIAEFRGDYRAALAYYDSALACSAQGNLVVTAHIRAAQQLLLLRQPRQALQRLAAARHALDMIRQERALLPQQNLVPDADALIELLTAEALSQIGQFAQAIERYYAVTASGTLQHSALRWQAYLGIGWAELNRRRYPDAIAAYRTVIDSVADVLSLQRAQALLFRAVAVERSGDVLNAIELFDALIADPAFPLRAQALIERGQIEYTRAQYRTAWVLFDRAYRAASDPATMLRGLLLRARAEFDLRRWDSTIRSCNELEQHAQRLTATVVPNLELLTAEALLLRGIAAANDGRYSDAITDLGLFIARYPNHDRRDEALLWLAECYERSNMLENAVAALEQLLNQYPNSLRREEALYNLGWAQFRLRKFDAATQTFDRLLAEFPRTPHGIDVTLRKADMLYLSKKYADAARLYRQVVKTTPQSDDGEYALFQVGQSLYRLGDYTNAAEHFRSFVRNFPESPIADDALYNIAWIRMLQGKWDDAIAMFNTLLRSYPNSELAPAARFYIAQCTYNSGQYVRAIDLYRQFLADYPSSSLAGQAIEAIQDAYINLGQDSLAVEVGREYIERNPTSEQSAQIAFRTTDIFVRNRDFSSAIKEYERFIEQYPSSRYVPDALYGLLKSLLELGKADDAERVLRRLVQHYDSSQATELALVDMAAYWASNSFSQRADSLFSVVMTRYPGTQSFARAAFERARIALARGDSTSALALWRLATTGAGEYAYQAYYRLGMWYRERGSSDTARAMFRPIIGYNDNPPLAAEAAYRIGELWQREGNCAAAADTFSLVLDRFEGIEDWYTLSLLGLAECAETQGDRAKARQLYQTIMILRPDDDFGRTAAARRRRLEKRP